MDDGGRARRSIHCRLSLASSLLVHARTDGNSSPHALLELPRTSPTRSKYTRMQYLQQNSANPTINLANDKAAIVSRKWSSGRKFTSLPSQRSGKHDIHPRPTRKCIRFRLTVHPRWSHRNIPPAHVFAIVTASHLHADTPGQP